MSDLTITHAGVSVTPNSPGSSNAGSKRAVIRLTPTLTASEHADGDVLFTALEIPNAVQGEGGISVLKSAFILDYGKEDTALGMSFLFTEGSIAIGTVDATANISDANMVLNKLTGFTKMLGTASNEGGDLDDMRIYQMIPASGVNENVDNLTYLKAADGSTSSYMHAVITSVDSTAPTFTANQLEIILHIEY
jgi:hypothetical protein